MTSGDDTKRGAGAPAGRRRGLVIGLAVVTVVGAIAVGVALYARGGGPLPDWAGILRPPEAVLEPSSPAESVLRTLRLAGYERAAVGDADGSVVVRVETPGVGTTADIQMAWQTGMAAASAVYPDASTIVVQVFASAQPLVEVSASAEGVRAAVAADDASALRRLCTFRYLSELTGG